MNNKNINKKKWRLKPKFNQKIGKSLEEFDDIILQLLSNRGLKEQKEIKNFLYDDINSLHDPFLFKDMKRAVDLIIKHIKKKNTIYIYGDYDADGVTSSALLKDILETLKAKVLVYLPDRVSEGYGLNADAIDYIKKQGAKLIITVDSGIRSKDEVEHARSMGIDVIISDHHPISGDDADLPNCLIINPALGNEDYPFKKLAGVGVAFKIAKAVISRAKLSEENKQILSSRLLDLVAIGTIADCVPLIGENRILAKEGLKILSRSKRKGLNELLKISGVKEGQELKAWNVGFQIGPRINAAGRMDHANSAFKLLTEKNKDKVKKLASMLNQRNIERQQITEDIVEEVISGVDAKDEIIIGVCKDDAWNEGVVGLVAGRICERFYRPTLIITETAEGYKGSGRSIAEFNLAEAIEECSEYLDKYGGHPLACGFSLKPENMDKFRVKLRKIAHKKLKGVNLSPSINIDVEVDASLVNEDLYEKIKILEPFGQMNEQPKFVSRNLVLTDINFMGLEGQHIKIIFKGATDNLLTAIGFSQSEKWQNLEIGEKFDIVYYLDLNEFNGRREVQMKIVDINKSLK